MTPRLLPLTPDQLAAIRASLTLAAEHLRHHGHHADDLDQLRQLVGPTSGQGVVLHIDTPDSPRMLNLADAAAATGRSTRTLRRRVATGHLRAHRRGRALTFHPADLAEWLRNEP